MAAELHPPTDVPGWQVVHELGREYGTYRRGQYLLPHDERERVKLDMTHTVFKLIRPFGSCRLTNVPTERLSLSEAGQLTTPLPLGMRPRVLDLGCGTGIWMNEMAREFPQAEFVGVDIHRLWSQCQPPNVSARIWDYEQPWALGERSWDMIHLQMGLGSVSDWPSLYSKIIQHLIPGSGCFESVEIDFEPRCDDGSMQPGKFTELWGTYLKNIFQSINRPIHYDPNTGDILRAIGFKDVHHMVYKVPFNMWSSDRQEWKAGQWWAQIMSRGRNNDGGNGMDALTLAALCKHQNWSVPDVEAISQAVVEEATNPACHGYNNVHVWWGRAPDIGEV
ncbi:hypothetical protein A1O3_02886 [Capronia epimyces CBS 606.96]|uniref:Methyltransferase domain-containing protein n=1 Tax=Capronia epimyces CBS 606.96 TaxID=1182542 RepID=W9Z5N7_9EURO|nr:uncharacterized protein A1O3_02886 [Capronia epimyces CBS 606.96]EXJ89819.1 hypothetical protein A1O3_02886 [Capronia epimyces CBS 606.96]